jgi:hypothetical protein
MADVTIDGVVEDTEVTGGEKIPVSDGGIPKAVTTDRLKDFVLKRIAALASADKVDTASDGVYLLKGGELKPVSAAVLAAAVMDYAFALAPVEAITGNETVSIKDATVKKTLSLDMLKSWLTEGSVTAEDLKEVADSVADKVDKEEGKGLSEENFSAEDKAKLDGLVSNAQPDWEQTDDTAPDFIKNKPTIPEGIEVDQVLNENSPNPIANGVVAIAIRNAVGINSIRLNGFLFNAEQNRITITNCVTHGGPPNAEMATLYPPGTLWNTGADLYVLVLNAFNQPEWMQLFTTGAVDFIRLEFDQKLNRCIKGNDKIYSVTEPPPGTTAGIEICRCVDNSLWINDCVTGWKKIAFVDEAFMEMQTKSNNAAQIYNLGETNVDDMYGSVQEYPRGALILSTATEPETNNVKHNVYINLGDGTEFKPVLLSGSTLA